MTGLTWTAREVIDATGGRGPDGWVATGVSIDSRTVQPGDLFIALIGDRLDGHLYIEAALRRGAAAAIVARRPDGIAPDAPLVEVADTMAALQALGAAARSRSRAKIVAVTGSVGKTSTKEALRLVLGRQGSTHASEGNLNNHWGAPLSLARMPADCDFAVFELGMNHAGEIAPLSRLVRPHVAIITTVEPAHLAFFRSVEAIADAKAEIFDGLEPGGGAVLNRDNPHYARMAEAAITRGARITAFGTNGVRPPVRMVRYAPDAEGSVIDVEILGEVRSLRIGAPGRHWAVTGLIVIATSLALGIDLDAVIAALADVSPPAGRGRRLSIELADGRFTLIDDSYNASPASMRAAFEVLSLATTPPGGRRMAVLGDMLELGADAPALHAGLATTLSDLPIDTVHACGPLMAQLYRALPAAQRGSHAATSDMLAPLIAAIVRPGDVVMVKGSLGSRMARVVEALTVLDRSPRNAKCG
jgi:UDP-N-acetylmuramoyl-tripeptide--D-alanyl-D-alanine ligase